MDSHFTNDLHFIHLIGCMAAIPNIATDQLYKWSFKITDQKSNNSQEMCVYVYTI